MAMTGASLDAYLGTLAAGGAAEACPLWPYRDGRNPFDPRAAA